MLPFMKRQGEPGPYMMAFEQSLAAFIQADPRDMARHSGGRYDSETSAIILTSLGEELEVSFPDGKVTFGNTDLRLPWAWELIVLNYLGRADGTEPSVDMVSFRELQGGRTFHQAFARYTISRLAGLAVDENLGTVRKACLNLGGELLEIGDLGARVPFLPRFRVTVILWAKDDEFDASANILFDRTANHYLHTEDVSGAGGLVVRYLADVVEHDHGTNRAPNMA